MKNKQVLLEKLQELQEYIALIANNNYLDNCDGCDIDCNEREQSERDKWIMFVEWLKQEVSKH